jgi:Flp pilus assembly protein TadD
MNRLLATAATIALCAFWTGSANAGLFDFGSSDDAKPTAATLTGPAATQSKPGDQPGDNDPDMVDIVKNLPANLDGEIRRAQLLRANGHYAEAAKSLSQIMIVAPDDPRVVGEFGKVMVQEGRSQDALQFLKRAIQLDSGDWTLYSALGIAYDQLDDHAHARAAYEHALSLKPGEASVLNNYAVSRMLTGDLPGAQRLLAQASMAGDANPKIANNVAMLTSMRPSAALAPSPAVAVATATSASAPRQLPGATKAPAIAVAKLGPAAPSVVMEKVPTDALAGPVPAAHPKVTKLAKAATHPKKAKTALASKDAPNAPVLRTAAQVN